MKLDKFKDEIYKCSGCGLCQNVCPVYKILKTESAVSRGKFKLLNSILNKDLCFSRKTLSFMELCLHCQACTEFCPSGIDAQKIVETAQCDMRNYGIFNYFKYFVICILQNKFFMKIVKCILNAVRKYKLLNLCVFKSKQIELLKSFLKINITPPKNKSDVTKNIKVLYFKGCINNYVNPSSQNAVYKILDKTSVEITEADFNCCGLPSKSTGDFEKFKQIAQDNINKIKDDFDYLIFDCLSCKSTFLSYPDFLAGTDKIKAENISEKIISIYELLDIIKYEPQNTFNNTTVTLHYPCHSRKTKDKEILAKLLKKIPNVNYVEAQNADSCCGAAGTFFITNNKLSKQISEKKADDIIKTNAEYVLTACPACYLGLKQGLLEKNSQIQPIQLIEFLAININ